MNKQKMTAKEIFSIPNLMGYFRILLIPVFSWIYIHADGVSDYYMAAVLVGISGLTDMFDGKVARKFNMITELGKFIDPLADKLTQGALVLCFAVRYPLMRAVLALFILKEGFMGIIGAAASPQREEAGWRHVVRQGVHRGPLRSAVYSSAVPWNQPDGRKSSDICMRRLHAVQPYHVHPCFSENVEGERAFRKINSLPGAGIKISAGADQCRFTASFSS